MSSSSGIYYCRYCKTTDDRLFYVRQPNSCKICRIPKNRQNDFTPISRDPTRITEAKCLYCNQIKLKDHFNISKSGFISDKCKDCKFALSKKNKNPEQSITNTAISILSETQLKNVRIFTLEEWVKTLQPSQLDCQILFDIYDNMANSPPEESKSVQNFNTSKFLKDPLTQERYNTLREWATNQQQLNRQDYVLLASIYYRIKSSYLSTT